MSLSPKEHQRNQELFQQMSTKEKAAHIWLYYKGVILLGVLAVVILCSVLYTSLTRKEPVLYTAFLNVTGSHDAQAVLSEDYLLRQDLDPKKSEIYFHADLYLSDNPSPENYQYANTSYLKIMATIDAKQLDIVLMNREAYDICSVNGYLLDLTQVFSPEDPVISPLLTSNLVLLEDNFIEFELKEAEEYIAVTDTVFNALEVGQLPLIQQAGFSGEVYLGIVANTPRLSECTEYVLYLTE